MGYSGLRAGVDRRSEGGGQRRLEGVGDCVKVDGEKCGGRRSRRAERQRTSEGESSVDIVKSGE